MSDVDTNIEASTESREGRKEYIPNRMGLPGSCDGLRPRQLFHLQPCRQKVSSIKSGFPSGVHRVVDARREHRRERRWKVGRSSRGDKHDHSPSGQPLVFKVFCVARESSGGFRTRDENGIYKREQSWGQRFAQEKRPSLARLRSYHCTDPNRDSCGGWGPALGATHETFFHAARLFLQREAGPRQRRDIVMMVQP